MEPTNANVEEANSLVDPQQDLTIITADNTLETTNAIVEEANSLDDPQQHLVSIHEKKRRNTRSGKVLEDSLSKNFLPSSFKRSKRR